MPGTVMLITEINTEPLIRVGLILPEDKRQHVDIDIPNKDKDYLSVNGISGKLEIRINDDGLIANGQKYQEILLSPDEPNDYLTVYSIPAGRGFHWEKLINIKLFGHIHVKNVDGNIALINQLPLEKYIPYVVTAEMSPECPPAFVEAQTVAARSWLFANRKVNHPAADFDVCNDDCCQRYQGIVDVPIETLQAIQNTFGKVISHEDTICDARYSKCCGGITESFENVWNGKPIPYLKSVEDVPHQSELPINIEDHLTNSRISFCSAVFVSKNDIKKYLGMVDETDSYYRWDIKYTNSELVNILNNKLELNVDQIIDIIPIERGTSGRIIKLKIEYFDKKKNKYSTTLKSEYSIRNALHEKFLFSSAFLIEKFTNEQHIIQKIKFVGGGWGHGVGMCQIGALGMALNNYSSDDILKHYFRDSMITKLY